MADYAIIGKKGTGKSLGAVGFIRQALMDGKRVATNLNINLDSLMHYSSMKTIIRIPDHPTVEDLIALGRGQAGVVEDDNGLIVLDECSHFMNARQFQDKSRVAVLEWLTQSRKLGWDVFYIMQGLAQMDKQVRETMLEYVVSMKRTDKWPVPVIGPLSRAILGPKHQIRFPKMHIAVMRQGVDQNAFVCERRFFRSHELFNAYETQQLFRPRLPAHPEPEDFNRCSDGLHTMLSAWHLKGRYMKQQPTFKDKLVLPYQILIWFACKLFSHPVPLKRERRTTLVGQNSGITVH